MRDLCLKFTNVKQMNKSLVSAGFSETESGLYHPAITLDVVAVIYEPENPDTENSPYIAQPGYHANIRVMDDELDLSALEKFIVTPKTPIRVWA